MAIRTINSSHYPRKQSERGIFHCRYDTWKLLEHLNKLWTWWTLQELCSEWSMAVNIKGAAQAGACTAMLFLILLQWDMSPLCSHVKREVYQNSDDLLHRSAERFKFKICKTFHFYVFLSSTGSHQPILKTTRQVFFPQCAPSQQGLKKIPFPRNENACSFQFTGSSLSSAKEFGFCLDYSSCWVFWPH